MSTYRLAPTAHAHTIAELSAFPFVSETAFHLSPIGLRPAIDGDTATLWREAERTIVGASSGLSLDEAVALRDATWFDNQPEQRLEQPPEWELPLHEHLPNLARSYLRQHGNVAVPSFESNEFRVRHDKQEIEARQAWRWLSLAIPPDLLLAALPCSGEVPSRVDTVSDAVAARLAANDGFAETHLHIGAGMDFGLLWVGAMHSIADTGVPLDILASPGADFDEGKDLTGWLLRSAIGRCFIAAFLGSPNRDNFGEFLRRAQKRLRDPLGPVATMVLWRALGDLAEGKFLAGREAWRRDHRLLQQVYATISGVRRNELPRSIDFDRQRHRATAAAWLARVNACDPVADFIDIAHGTSAERQLVVDALKYIRSRGDTCDRSFEKLFWQCTRIRCIYYRHVVQRPMTPGLQWFIRVYDRSGSARRPFVAEIRALAAATSSGLGRGLASLEIRTAPQDSLSGNLSFFQSFERAMAVAREDAEGLEGGVVMHFVRDRGEDALRKGLQAAFWAKTAAEPNPDKNAGYRYSSFYRKKRREAYVAGRLLANFPASLAWLRGVDLCTDEVGIPTWVMGPPLRYLHDAGQLAAQTAKRELGVELPPLRRSVHAGEDFVHLLTGLRRLHEPIRFLKVGAGDRIGHGFSLALEPKRWAQRIGRVAILREERLFDLVWAWSWYARGGISLPASELPAIEEEIAEHARTIFGSKERDISPRRLCELQKNLHEEWVLRRLGFPTGPIPSKEEVGEDHRLELRWLTDQGVFQRSHDIVWVATDREAELLEALQLALAREISEAGIIIEVNPSSNLLIGQLSDLEDHPLWRLQSLDDDAALPAIDICIGSDDPLVFATDLRQEYQLLHDTLVQSGKTSYQANTVIDRLRAASMAARFTLPSTLGKALPHGTIARMPALDAAPVLNPMP